MNNENSFINSVIGKEELGEFDESNINLKILTEPVNKWKNLEGNNLLELMYQDPKKWAFSFHSYVQLTMLENHIDFGNINESVDDVENLKSKYNINIMERSLYSAKYCFVENLFRS